MAFGIVQNFPGGTREQYETGIKSVHPDDGSLPEGQLHHFAGPTEDGGWIICTTWNSRESWDRFREDILIPRLQSIEGLPDEFQETTYEVANELHA
jgi:hypothetical protein